MRTQPGRCQTHESSGLWTVWRADTRAPHRTSLVQTERPHEVCQVALTTPRRLVGGPGPATLAKPSHVALEGGGRLRLRWAAPVQSGLADAYCRSSRAPPLASRSARTAAPSAAISSSPSSGNWRCSSRSCPASTRACRRSGEGWPPPTQRRRAAPAVQSANPNVCTKSTTSRTTPPANVRNRREAGSGSPAAIVATMSTRFSPDTKRPSRSATA